MAKAKRNTIVDAILAKEKLFDPKADVGIVRSYIPDGKREIEDFYPYQGLAPEDMKFEEFARRRIRPILSVVDLKEDECWSDCFEFRGMDPSRTVDLPNLSLAHIRSLVRHLAKMSD